jgi:predicted ester cyclase
MLAVAAERMLLTSPSDERSRTMSTKNETVVRRCLEHAARGDFNVLSEVVSPSYALHPGDIHGVAELVEMVQGYRDALADLRVRIDHQFTSGDHVATRSTITGRHEGELLGTAPTGREVSFTMLTISRCGDGKIEEEWEIADTVGLLEQVGALPAAT